MADLQAFSGSPLTDSNRRPPPYHGTSHATGRNPRQRFWLIFAVLATAWLAAECHRLQPRGSIKAPSSVVRAGYVAADERPRFTLTAPTASPASWRSRYALGAQNAFAADFHSRRRCAACWRCRGDGDRTGGSRSGAESGRVVPRIVDRRSKRVDVEALTVNADALCLEVDADRLHTCDRQ
jgi:hypothetical protein